MCLLSFVLIAILKSAQVTYTKSSRDTGHCINTKYDDDNDDGGDDEQT